MTFSESSSCLQRTRVNKNKNKYSYLEVNLLGYYFVRENESKTRSHIKYYTNTLRTKTFSDSYSHKAGYTHK